MFTRYTVAHKVYGVLTVKQELEHIAHDLATIIRRLQFLLQKLEQNLKAPN